MTIKQDSQHALNAGHGTGRFSVRLLPLALTLALGACSLAPTYERPETPSGATWTANQADTDTARTAAEISWQEFFLDPQLKALIGISLENNRDLRVALLRVEEARAQYRIQRADQLPNIGVNGQVQRSRTAEQLRAGGPDSPALGTVYQVGLAMTSYELDFFGRVRNLSEAALQQYLATEQAAKTARIALVTEVANAYFAERAAETLLDLGRKTREARQASYELVLARFEGGVATELELNQARGLRDAIDAELAQLQRSSMQAKNALALLIGQELPADLPAPAPFGSSQLITNIPVGVPSSLLTQRPDILGAENQLLSANASIGAARAAFFPSISLTGQFGTASTHLSDLFGSGSGAWSFVPVINLPIFTAGRLQANLDVAEVRKDIAVANYEKTIQQAFREVADALAGEATYGDQLKALRAQESAAGRTLELSNLRYETGVDSYLQVQTAQISHFSAQQAVVQAEAASLNNRVALYKALGGGWQAEDLAAAQRVEAENAGS
ncbi:efflux transporter outer membrane subunit [Kerstersia gyiorum]|uniref:efflux transporter outer membrane subunit n=1 Tax=Kerstersia gyiorum TaxID=206506 RepID=UPI000A01F266|nr:efflux transporter outer membrane subunit [Kerstersia gyiorum]